MSAVILNQFTSEIKQQYDFIPYANWDNSVKGSRPAPYKLKQRYDDSHELWGKSELDRIGIRLNQLVLVDYDGNKENAVGEIPSVSELATALGYDSQQSLFDASLMQWNEEMTSLHFLFVAPPEFNVTDFKQHNGGTEDFFWKHIDIKTANQLVYLKTAKTALLRDPSTYDIAPPTVMEQLKERSVKSTSDDFDYNHKASDHQIELAEQWLHIACTEMQNAEDGGRNNKLNSLACTVAGLVAGGALENSAAYTLMFEAAIAAGCEYSETVNTLASAWEEGGKTPRRDAPYLGTKQTASEAFEGQVIHNTNVDTKADNAITELVKSGVVSDTDPDVGILHEQYKFFMENWVMNKAGNFINRNTLADFNKAAFNTMHLHMMPVRPGSKSMKKFDPSEVFEKANPTVISDVMYRPDQPRVFNYEGIDYLNSYIEFNPARPSDADIAYIRTLLQRHLSWLFADPDHRRYMLDWMAWQVQRTGELIGWVPLIMGCLGDGKSVLADLVSAAIGTRNVKSVGNKSINSEFQDWAVGASVGVFEELKTEERKSKQVANDLKPFITELRPSATGKGTKSRDIYNTMNYIAFSNEANPIAITVGDRRWLVLETQHFGKNNVIERTQTDMEEHFDRIMETARDGKFAPAVHWMLREHVMSDEFEKKHRKRAPQTVFSHSLNEQTVSEKENRLQEYLDNATFLDGRSGRLLADPDGFQVQDFRPMMPDNWFQGMDKKPSAIILGRWLRNLGYEHASRVSVVDGRIIKTFKKV
jgi:hypothetical protein